MDGVQVGQIRTDQMAVHLDLGLGNDALADTMLTATNQAVAFDQMWQMERMLADDLPYIILFTTPVTEFHNKDLNFPFTQTLGGISYLNGMPGLVAK